MPATDDGHNKRELTTLALLAKLAPEVRPDAVARGLARVRAGGCPVDAVAEQVALWSIHLREAETGPRV